MMRCPRCDVDMILGQAIDAGPDYNRAIVFCQHIINASNLKLIDCFKCPKCGHSDDGINGNKLFGVINHNE